MLFSPGDNFIFMRVAREVLDYLPIHGYSNYGPTTTKKPRCEPLRASMGCIKTIGKAQHMNLRQMEKYFPGNHS